MRPHTGSRCDRLDAAGRADGPKALKGAWGCCYYAGHGLRGPDVDGLLLALASTDPERPYTSVDFDAVRREVLEAGRRVNKVVILDCCYGGRR
ncbi:hypothetical protein ACWEV4_16025 [Streptomyces sp. NPDC003860]